MCDLDIDLECCGLMSTKEQITLYYMAAQKSCSHRLKWVVNFAVPFTHFARGVQCPFRLNLLYPTPNSCVLV